VAARGPLPTEPAGAPDDPGLAPVGVLAGVGPALREKLERLGIARLQDLWFHLPREYEDRTRITPIRQLQPGTRAQVEGRVEAVERGFRYRPQLRVAIGDDSQRTLMLRFFHFRGGQAEQFVPGSWVRCYGDVREGAQGLEMVHPAYQRLAGHEVGTPAATLTPVYPAVEGLGQASLVKLVARALDRLPPDAALELLPAPLRRRLALPSLREALLTMHRPPEGADTAALLAGAHPAQQRLAFEELLAHQLSLRLQRIAVRRHGAPVLRPPGALARQLEPRLPFALTGAQRRVLETVRADLARSEPMLRLVQGDVGSGKTVVAALAALQAVESGAQAALMAPTELLAEQHYVAFRRWLEPLGIEVVWLAGKVKGRARAQALARIAAGAGVVIGTHALVQEGVAFRNLALVIVDEQHRFGVHQRLALRDKGRATQPAPLGRGMDAERGGRRDADDAATLVPHTLVMTATPIPRTLAMTAYADLDVSVIDELPPGRTPIQTVAVSAERRSEVIERIRAACAEGRQAYWVCTLIEELDEAARGADKLALQAAEKTFELLTAQLPGLRVGLVHGRLRPAQKQAVMDAFKAGELQLLVATTVIEVGVDVPNASLMLVENAERLGLAQLHQLRGRVGRGAQASSCVLLYQAPLSALARERLAVMRETTDGFVIAEKDLELRGPGELLGTRQTGLAAFRVADLMRDAGLLPAVQAAADEILARDAALAERLIARWIGRAARYAAA
jgi:ATP-dependent DNA helicase RecG